MSDKKLKSIMAVCIGVPAIIAFGCFTNVGAAAALFCVVWAKNIGGSVND